MTINITLKQLFPFFQNPSLIFRSLTSSIYYYFDEKQRAFYRKKNFISLLFFPLNSSALRTTALNGNQKQKRKTLCEEKKFKIT